MRGRREAESAFLPIRAQPRASADQVVGWQDGALKVRVTAPPVDDAANRAILELLARTLGVPRSHVSVVRGVRGRQKLIRIAGLSQERLDAELARRIAG